MNTSGASSARNFALVSHALLREDESDRELYMLWQADRNGRWPCDEDGIKPTEEPRSRIGISFPGWLAVQENLFRREARRHKVRLQMLQKQQQAQHHLEASASSSLEASATAASAASPPGARKRATGKKRGKGKLQGQQLGSTG